MTLPELWSFDFWFTVVFGYILGAAASAMLALQLDEVDGPELVAWTVLWPLFDAVALLVFAVRAMRALLRMFR